MDGCWSLGSYRVKPRGLILTGVAVLVFAAPAGGIARPLASVQPCEVSSVDPSAAALDTSADETAGDPVPADPASAVEQAPDRPAEDVFLGFEIDQRPDLILVDVGWGGFGPQYRLAVSQSGRANISSFSRGHQRIGSFRLSRAKLARLKSDLEQARFRSLRSRYVPTYRCSDCPSYSITYAGRTVTIVRFNPSDRDVIPPRLDHVVSLAAWLVNTHWASLVEA